MILADHVIAYAQSTLGLIRLKHQYNPGTLYARLADCVSELRDKLPRNPEIMTIKTVADQGQYELDSVYDEIDTIIWPSAWLNPILSTDEDEEILIDVNYGGEPKYVTKNELLRLQSYYNSASGGGSVPIYWSQWRDVNDKLIIAVCDSNTVAADLTITLHLHRVEYKEFRPGAEIPLPAYMKRLLQFKLVAAMTETYAPDRSPEFLAKVEKELIEIETDHASRQFAEIKQFDVSYYPSY